LQLELTLEDGSPWPFSHASLTAVPPQRVEVGGRFLSRRTVPLTGLPLGYHRLEARSAGRSGSAVVISAPRTCVRLDGRPWGAFLPLYAVRSRRNWGCGDLTDLAELRGWVESLGGALVGTLPLLASDPSEASPYSPLSRLFWNELFVDVEAVPELDGSPTARELMATPGFRREVEGLRRTRLVDYRAASALKRSVLEHLSRSFFDDAPSERRKRFDAFVRSRPHLREYATFRAAAAHHGAGWTGWPRRERAGKIPPGSIQPGEVRYHQYAQWVAEEQIAAATTRRRGLLLDLPVGVKADGFDTWRFRYAFALGARAGAPPDAFFSKGQDWGFPPPHPEGIRSDGYAYLRAALGHHLRHAGALRIDHVMGLHRLYWVPPGMDATSGVYIRYRPEEWYAVVALESHRARAAIAGEDLGTVPPVVHGEMDRHGVMRSNVLQLEALTKDRPLPDPHPLSVASLNTHDLPTFAAFWQGTDIDDRLAQGLIDAREARKERRSRSRLRTDVSAALRQRGLLKGRGTEAVLNATLRHLARSRARMVVVSLEDLWLEPEPQNRPGTGPEQPNWRRKAARTLESLRMDRGIAGTLQEIDGLRRRDTRGAT
jgi:4-alpha-glucanotransferase